MDDHPGKTAADFADDKLTDSVLHEFEVWLASQHGVADGYLVRLGGGKYQRTEKPGALVRRVRRGGGQHDPERLPGEDDAAYWTRFSRLNRECIEELEREMRRKEKRPSGAP